MDDGAEFLIQNTSRNWLAGVGTMSGTSAEEAILAVVTRLDAAWRTKQFDGLEQCFDDNAVIVGPNYQQYAVGRRACAES